MSQLYIETGRAKTFALRASRSVVPVCLLGLYLLATLACQRNHDGSPAQPAPTEPPLSSASASPREPTVSHDPARLEHYEITPASLPQPYVTADVDNPPALIPQPADAQLYMPPGFAINTFASGGFERARWMASAPNGDVFVADAGSDKVLILRDSNQDGVADTRFTFAERLNKPFGMAFWRDYFYVANTNAVMRFHYQPGQTKSEGPPEKIVDLPGQGYNQHWTRNIIFNPKATKLYITVGSASDADVEPEPRAAILECNPDGTAMRIFASGLRNPIGLSFRPGTNALWAAVQERDRLGDDLPPDYVTEIRDGGFYGWPYAYAGPVGDPRHAGARPDLVKQTIVPDVLIQAHSAILGLVFYTGTMFPEEYRGDAFVAMHGSWNRTRRTGYKIARVPFREGKPEGGYDDFVTGWALDEERRQVWGRPVGLLLLTDGSLLVTDDGANKIWRISYRAPQSARNP